MNKKANSKSLPDESNANADDTKGGASLAGDDSGSADMSADEMAMFDKIMGEIEGQEQKGAQAKDDEAAEGDESIAPDPAVQQDEGLDEEQQKAFENIMAQIENGDTSPQAEADTNSGDGSDEELGEDDFAAELEKIAKEAETASQDKAPATGADDGHDDLDEDQRKALESIMAQIQGGDKVDDSPQTNDDSGDEAQTDEDVDFAAELEKIAKEAETASQDKAPSTDLGDGHDELDEDQQNALESIMAEIESKSSNKAARNIDPSSSEAGEKNKPSSQEAKADKDTDADSEDISDDIEDILKEITSDFEASDEEGLDEKPDTDVIEAASRDHDNAETETDKEKGGGAASEKRLPETDTQTEENAAEEKPDPSKDALDSKPVAVKKASEESLPSKVSRPAHRTAKSRRLNGKTAIFVFVGIVSLLSLAGWYYLKSHSTRENKPVPPAVVIEENVQPAAVATAAKVEAPRPEPENDDSSDQSRLKSIADEIDQLRSELIAKRKEIEELRVYYQTGIDAEIENLVNTLQNTDNEKMTPKQAMLNPLVSMGINAIQRRESYIRKLENPANTLYLKSEELFYLFRKAGMLAMLAEKTSDIDVDGFIEQTQVIMTVHRNELAQLNIDDVEVAEPDIESIWRQIESKLAKVTKKSDSTAPAERTEIENQTIWAAVCSGNFSQKHKLTALSTEAARCLASWKGKDLFLNELTSLTPEAAGQLADWNGEWLGLNGIKDLAPETAVYLAKWKGRGLSLNGLTRLSPRVVAILSEWQGDQIELVNVKHMAHWENPKTRLFLSEEMQRKINDKRQ